MSRTTATIGGEGRLHAASAAWYANADSDAISTAVLADALARHLLEEAQLRDADFVVRPKAHVSNFADFSNPGALIAAGERAAQETLPQIVAVLERHRSLFVRVAPQAGGNRPSP